MPAGNNPLGCGLAFSRLVYSIPYKQLLNTTSHLGLVLALMGQLMRTLAMQTAKSNFKHQVATEREDGHQLVTHGIYGWCRHPSYLGFFLWAMGTQLLLVNPVCLLAYCWVLMRFFTERIEHEEAALLVFFGDNYKRYKQRTWSGLPFVQ